jgi:hypothetical protein
LLRAKGGDEDESGPPQAMVAWFLPVFPSRMLGKNHSQK